MALVGNAVVIGVGSGSPSPLPLLLLEDGGTVAVVDGDVHVCSLLW